MPRSHSPSLTPLSPSAGNPRPALDSGPTGPSGHGPTGSSGRKRGRGLLLAAACLVGLGLAACGGPQKAPGSADFDIVLVVFDTFRPDHLGVNGYETTTAPFVEGLMAESTVFERAYSSSSWTAPSTSSIMTGLYPTGHGITEGFLAHRRRSENMEAQFGAEIRLNRLPDSIPTLAELLHAAGWSTYGLASNINIGSQIGFDRGFDHFERHIEAPAGALAAKLESWRDSMSRADQRFVYLHFNDVHEPYQKRAPWYEPPPGVDWQPPGPGEPIPTVGARADQRDDAVAAYDSEISYLDSVLERLYRDFQWRENTLFVLLSDHGEEFGDHGSMAHNFSLYDELSRVMMMVSGPDLGIPAQRVSTHVGLVDVLPTILDLAGVPSPDGLDGRSLRRFLDPTRERADLARFEERTLFAHRLRHRVSVGLPIQHLWSAVSGPWKLIHGPDGMALYHLLDDPRETTDVSRQHPDVVARLGAELDAFRARGFPAGLAQTDVELDPETLETLRSLGYVQ